MLSILNVNGAYAELLTVQAPSAQRGEPATVGHPLPAL